MNAQQLHERLTQVEVSSKYADEPDLRDVIRQERFALADALRSGDPERIASAQREALRVARMWHVDLEHPLPAN